MARCPLHVHTAIPRCIQRMLLWACPCMNGADGANRDVEVLTEASCHHFINAERWQRTLHYDAFTQGFEDRCSNIKRVGGVSRGRGGQLRGPNNSPNFRTPSLLSSQSAVVSNVESTPKAHPHHPDWRSHHVAFVGVYVKVARTEQNRPVKCELAASRLTGQACTGTAGSTSTNHYPGSFT